MAKNSFDAEKWIHDHNVEVKDLGFEESKKNPGLSQEKTLHFHFSFKKMDFRALQYKKADERLNAMFDLFKDLIEKMQGDGYLTKTNEWRERADGTVAQREGLVSLQDAKIALHNFGPEGKKDHSADATEEHIHIIAKQGSAAAKTWGLEFGRLRNAIEQISAQHGLVPNFADKPVHYNPKAVENLRKSVESFSWSLRSATNPQLQAYLDQEGWLEKKVQLAVNLAVETGNLQYYSKTMERLSKRLGYLGRDFEFSGHNLRESFPVPLREEDRQAIAFLRGEGEMPKNANNTILRGYANWVYGDKSPVVDALKKHTNELDGVGKSLKKAEEIDRLGHSQNLAKWQKTEDKERDLTVLNQKELLEAFKGDLSEILTTAKNEKEVKEQLKSKGWGEVGDKTYKKERIGWAVDIGNNRVTIKYKDVGTTRAELMHTLQQNTQNQQKGDTPVDQAQQTRERIEHEFAQAKIRAKEGLEKVRQLRKEYYESKAQAMQEATQEVQPIEQQPEEQEQENSLLKDVIGFAKYEIKEELKDKAKEQIAETLFDDAVIERLTEIPRIESDFFKKIQDAIKPLKEALDQNLYQPFEVDGMSLNGSFASLIELAKTGMEVKKVVDAINGEDRKEAVKELYEVAKHALENELDDYETAKGSKSKKEKDEEEELNNNKNRMDY